MTTPPPVSKPAADSEKSVASNDAKLAGRTTTAAARSSAKAEMASFKKLSDDTANNLFIRK